MKPGFAELASHYTKALEAHMRQSWKESDIYRIDRYLGAERRIKFDPSLKAHAFKPLILKRT